jgi:hypothetical protein
MLDSSHRATLREMGANIVRNVGRERGRHAYIVILLSGLSAVLRSGLSPHFSCVMSLFFVANG